MKRKAILLLFSGLISLAISQTMNRELVEKSIQDSPAFSIFRDNYFITGSALGSMPTKYISDAKFQVSFKYRIMNKPLIYDIYPYLAYTQKSFWDIFQNSAPFAESNYNPAFFLARPFFKDNEMKSLFTLGVEHESNGRDSISGTRSWNFISMQCGFFLNPALSAGIKLWAPFATEENPDLMDYIGYGEASLNWIIIQSKLSANLSARVGKLSEGKGNIKMELAYRPFRNRNQHLLLQWYEGYAESLINYQQKVNMLRIGFVLKPDFYRFY